MSGNESPEPPARSTPGVGSDSRVRSGDRSILATSTVEVCVVADRDYRSGGVDQTVWTAATGPMDTIFQPPNRDRRRPGTVAGNAAAVARRVAAS